MVEHAIENRSVGGSIPPLGTGNGATAKPWLRAVLLGISLAAYIATQIVNGTSVDPNVVSTDLQAIVATGVLAYFAHAFYNSAFRRVLGFGVDQAAQ